MRDRDACATGDKREPYDKPNEPHDKPPCQERHEAMRKSCCLGDAARDPAGPTQRGIIALAHDRYVLNLQSVEGSIANGASRHMTVALRFHVGAPAAPFRP